MILEYCDKVKLVFRFCKVLARDLKYICLIFTWIEFQIKKLIIYSQKAFVKVNISNACTFCKYTIYEKSAPMHSYR